jgi:enoyl-CoA hydratase/carnithine racemase
VLQKVQIGRVLKLTLDRPEKRNALNCDLCQALVESIARAVHDPGIGAILLSANGKSFCAGMDLAEAALGVTEEINTIHARLFTVGERAAKPLIAAVQGAALGGGTGLVANCHIVIAGPDATFGLTEIRLGLWPFLIYRAVEKALGERRTLELALTGRIFGPEKAQEMGLVHEISADPETRALEVADSVANWSPTAIQNGMAFVQEVRGQDGEASGRTARRIRDRVFAGADFQEGVRAFREKRSPRWPSLST